MAFVGLIAAIAGAAMQNKAQQDQASQQQRLALQSQQRQLQAQNQATNVATQEAQQFDPATHQKAQDAIAQTLTDKYTQAAAQPAVTAQGVQVGSTLPAGQGGSAYTADQAVQAAKTAESMRQLAGIMGRTGSPSLLRQQEAVGIGDAAGAIGRIQTGANNTAGIDQIGIQTVIPNAALSIGGQALQAYGAGKMGTAGLSKSVPYGQVQGAPSGPTGAWL